MRQALRGLEAYFDSLISLRDKGNVLGLSHPYYILFFRSQVGKADIDAQYGVFTGTKAWHIRIYGAQLGSTSKS